MDYILSVDLGTSAIKTALFDSQGGMLSVSNQEYDLLTPTALAVEMGIDTYWQAFKAGIADVVEQANVDVSKIRGMGISAQGETLIFVNTQGVPLRNAIVWMDNRAQKESEKLTEVFKGTDVYGITGQVSIVPTWPASKILWVKEHEKTIFEKTAKFLLIEDYFIHRMTGKYVAEGSLLCSTVYWDINKKCYWKEMLDYLGVSENQLPEIRESGEPVAHLLPDVAKELGLSPDMVVCTGVLDQVAGGIGVGNIQPGVFSECTGSALAIVATVDKSFKDPSGQMPCHYHGMPDTYMAHTFTTGGMVVKWFRDKFFQTEMTEEVETGINAFERMNQEAFSVPVGSDGLVMLPHLQGAMAPENNPKAKGVFYGVTLKHGRGHFVRSILESVSYIVKRNIDVLETMGVAVQEIRCLGGGAKSDLWNQIKADVTGRTTMVMENEEAASLGAAIVAGVGVGVFSSMESAVESMVKVKKKYQPNPDNVAKYSTCYQKYIDLYNSLVDMYAGEQDN